MCTDNDTRGPNNFIREQNLIIGTAADEVADHVNDAGHTAKNLSNKFYDIRGKDSSFGGAGMLENLRIKSIVSDTRKPQQEYKNCDGGIGNNPAAKQKCLEVIHSIVLHHSGDHSCCKHKDYCTYFQIKSENPGWSEEQVQEAYAGETVRFGGKYMDLSEYGIGVLQKEIKKRFNDKNIDKLAKLLSSNPCEGFFGIGSKFTQGKRLNLDQTDLWKSILLLIFCRVGHIDDIHKELSNLLGLDITTAELQWLKNASVKREKVSSQAVSDEGKKRRHEAKCTLAVRTGKDSAKTECHKTDKVDTTKSAKSKVKTTVKKCTKCGHEGHRTQECPMNKNDKKRKALINWDTIYATPAKIQCTKATISWDNWYI